ncbi:hypothetical protein ACQ86N_48065 [Puia sp. P3]
MAPNATIVGNVKMGDKCSVWFNASGKGVTSTVLPSATR